MGDLKMKNKIKRIIAVLMTVLTVLSMAVMPVSAKSESTTTEIVSAEKFNPVKNFSDLYHNGYEPLTVHHLLLLIDNINKSTQALAGIKIFDFEKIEFSAEGFIDDLFNEMADVTFFDGYEIFYNIPISYKSSQKIIDSFGIDMTKAVPAIQKAIDEHNANGESLKEIALTLFIIYLKQLKSIHVYEIQVNDNLYQLAAEMVFNYGGKETYQFDVFYDTDKQEVYTQSGTGIFNLGFNFDTSTYTLYSVVNSWQSHFGFTIIYDFIANIGFMRYNTRRVKFTYGGKEWMFQFWKGRYFIAPGAELGIYNRDIGSTGTFYNCATDDLMLMSMNLYHDGNLIFSRGPEMHWWITGFNVNKYCYLPDALVMTGTVEFPDEEMAELFTEEANKKFALSAIREGRVVSYIFG